MAPQDTIPASSSAGELFLDNSPNDSGAAQPGHGLMHTQRGIHPCAALFRTAARSFRAGNQGLSLAAQMLREDTGQEKRFVPPAPCSGTR